MDRTLISARSTGSRGLEEVGCINYSLALEGAELVVDDLPDNLVHSFSWPFSPATGGM
jgi:hypothetical protein